VLICVSLSPDIFVLKALDIMKKCSFVIFLWNFDWLYARFSNYILIIRALKMFVTEAYQI